MAGQQTAGKRSALILVDVQEDSCEPDGTLAVKGGRALAPVWNKLLVDGKYDVKVATHDWHPTDHISFASQHAGAQPFASQHTIQNPENGEESFATTLWPDHCVAETKGAQLISELDHKFITHRIFKGQDKRVECYSAFGPPFRKPAMTDGKLDDVLKQSGIENVVVVGLAYDYCVKHTALDAASLGYHVSVLENATKPVDASPENIMAVEKELEAAGVKVVKGTDGGV